MSRLNPTFIRYKLYPKPSSQSELWYCKIDWLSYNSIKLKTCPSNFSIGYFKNTSGVLLIKGDRLATDLNWNKDGMKTNEHELKPYKRVIAAEDPNKPVKSPIYLDMEYTSVYRYPFNILYSAKYIPFWYNFKWSDRSISPFRTFPRKTRYYQSKTTLGSDTD